MMTIRSKTRSLVGVAAVFFAATLGDVGCARDRSEFRDEAPPAPLLASEDASAAPACEDEGKLICSRDLKQVLRYHCDGTNDIVADCAPGLGCGNGACVEACASAELNKGSIGCSFATLPPDSTISGFDGSCFAAMIANVWDRPATVHATIGGAPLDISQSMYYAEMAGGTISYTPVDGAIAPGKVAIVFLAQSPPKVPHFMPCPRTVVPALREDPIAHKTARTRAFQLTTDTPVSAYSIWPYGGARSAITAATLLLPVSSWDRRYISVASWTVARGPTAWPFIQIVASEDDTEVRIRPNVTIDGDMTSGVVGVAEGQTQTWTLARGEVLQITQPRDTSGSPIETSKPVGLFGGGECPVIPDGRPACDSTHQQIAPVSQWGSAYALVPYRPRTDAGFGTTTKREAVPWRFVGAANGTKLTYDPFRPGGAPETLEAGQVVTFSSTEVVTVRSQDKDHPFHAAMYMTGMGWGTEFTDGDPDFVNAVPSEQFLDRYIFFTDHTYPKTTLTFVRRKTAAGFRPVTLACAGEITDWSPIGRDGEYEFAWLKITSNGVPQRFAAGTCDYGRHEAQSDGPFAVYVWGVGNYVSYGYPAGQGSRPLNAVAGPPVN